MSEPIPRAVIEDNDKTAEPIDVGRALPIRLEEGLRGLYGNQEVFETAARDWQVFKDIQEKNGFSDSDIELLADMRSPFRLMKMTPQGRLRLVEIREQMTGRSQREGRRY